MWKKLWSVLELSLSVLKNIGKFETHTKTQKHNTADSRYLEVEETLLNTSRYPYFDISDLQNWGKYQSTIQISQMNM